jgi:hypothetical protein
VFHARVANCKSAIQQRLGRPRPDLRYQPRPRPRSWISDLFPISEFGIRSSLLGLATFLAAAAQAANPALPVIPARTYYFTNYGAVGDGEFTNTSAFQSTINALSTAGGGTAELTPGTYLCGPFTLASSINLQLDAGAVLRMLPYGQYPGGIVSPANFISGSSLHDVEISGSGTIDGQGLPWWKIVETNSAANRPNMVSLSASTRVLIQDATFSNSPSPHLVIKGKAGNVTIQGVTIDAPPSSDPVNPSHNTDAIDLAETNCIIQNCNISVGDDNVAVGSSASVSADILITNCVFGNGHGVSIGSYTSGGVSNMTVINCSFTNTDQGIRIKSDRDRGGVVQNISYYNLTMGNVMYPILIYCSYTNTSSVFKSLNNLTPSIVATYPSNAVTSTTPIYRNLTISNVTGSAQSGRMAGLIWGLPEMLISNVTLSKVTLSGSKTFGIYYANANQLVDSQFAIPGSVPDVSFYNARLGFTNSAPGASLVTLDGAATNGIGNALSFYNAPASLQNTNALAADRGLTLSACTLAISNHLALDSSGPVNFILGTSPATVAVTSNLSLAGTINLSAGPGFTNGPYTLFTYGKGLTWGAPVLGTVPPGYNYSFDTNTPGQVRLNVQPAVSLAPVSLLFQNVSGQLVLSWPADHTGWHLQLQTNPLTVGLGTNWSILTGSDQTNRVFLPIDPGQDSVFLRLAYP